MGRPGQIPPATTVLTWLGGSALASVDAQLIAASVVYAGELIAAALYQAMAKEG